MVEVNQEVINKDPANTNSTVTSNRLQKSCVIDYGVLIDPITGELPYQAQQIFQQVKDKCTLVAKISCDEQKVEVN
jgi:hypothetical protein